MTSVRDAFADSSTLLQLERALRNCKSRRELYFVGVNEPYSIVAYDQAVMWIGNRYGKNDIVAVSGLASLEGSTPFTQWLSRVFHHLARQDTQDSLQIFTPADLPEKLQEEGEEWIPEHALHGILRSPRGEVIGGLWMMRTTPFDEREQALALWVTEALGFALWGWAPKRFTLQRIFGARVVAARVALGLGLFSAVSVIPVRLSVLAPATVTASSPTPVTAPVDGVVKRIFVQPSEPVHKGELLFKLDDTTTRNRLEVARKAREIAIADYQRASSEAFSSDKARGELLLLAARVREHDAEIAYLTELLQRLNVVAPASGIAVFADPNDWLGKPVQTGERIMMLDDPSQANLTIDLAPADAIQLTPGSDVHMYLNASPLTTYKAHITQTSYDVTQAPDGAPVYVLKAAFDPGQKLPRIGLRGTAKLFAQSVPLFYYVFRKPIAYVRRVFGF